MGIRVKNDGYAEFPVMLLMEGLIHPPFLKGEGLKSALY